MKKEILVEKTRQDLIAKSKNADQYKTRPGENRYTRRTKSRVAATVADYNRIDMDALWKGDILEFDINVQGETDNYIVTILFENLLDEFKRQIRQNNNNLEFRCILQALLKVFNSDDIYVHCSCPDFTYRQAYWATKGGYNSGTPQNDNGKWIANPNDSKGAGCKHVLLCLANLDWLMKIASVIHNYIWYCKEHMEYNYNRYIAPKLFDEVQGMLFNPDNPEEPEDSDANLDTDKDTINKANIQGRERGKFRPGSNKNPVTGTGGTPKKEPHTQEDDNPLELKFGQEKQLLPDEEA